MCKHGIGKCNSNGELLLALCSEFELTVTFKQKDERKTTSRHWHMIDFTITRCRDKMDIHSQNWLSEYDKSKTGKGQKLLNVHGDIDHKALENIPQRITKTCLDEIPTVGETARVIAGLKGGKTPGEMELLLKYGSTEETICSADCTN
ncbi:hypothetical protein NP493_2001g00003 [Ridgeia piscesae]|uniref:Uncharacterized protein n=1 Tax=Ridgeia piscesae TaxID=27915 RepID=A0AAD9N5V2_RIDPI|nr:hypothetical protein NP493_2001g00003 [Ridgeia piscesae]